MSVRGSRLRRLYVRSLPLVLASVAVINLSISTWIQPRGAPIRLHDEGSLTHLVHFEQRTTHRRYGFYMELGDVAAGQVLRVPEGAPIEVWMTSGLSGVELQVSEYDPSALPPEAIPHGEPLGVLSTRRNGDFPYWILPGDGPWWMGYHQDGIVIVPHSVAQPPGGGS
jgi:hypothetical protein